MTRNISLQVLEDGQIGDITDSAVSLGCSSNHVLNEITMSRSINDGDVVFGGLELPKGNIDCDTALTLSL